MAPSCVSNQLLQRRKLQHDKNAYFYTAVCTTDTSYSLSNSGEASTTVCSSSLCTTTWLQHALRPLTVLLLLQLFLLHLHYSCHLYLVYTSLFPFTSFSTVLSSFLLFSCKTMGNNFCYEQNYYLITAPTVSTDTANLTLKLGQTVCPWLQPGDGFSSNTVSESLCHLIWWCLIAGLCCYSQSDHFGHYYFKYLDSSHVLCSVTLLSVLQLPSNCVKHLNYFFMYNVIPVIHVCGTKG